MTKDVTSTPPEASQEHNPPNPTNTTTLDANPNSLHDHHKARRGPKNVPAVVVPVNQMANHGPSPTPSPPRVAKDPGHPYATTEHISFEFFDQGPSNAPFGYEHYVSLPPTYHDDDEASWPLILFLHGAGESQRVGGAGNESYASLRHGIPKVILCYDRLKRLEHAVIDQSSLPAPSIDIPPLARVRKTQSRTITKQVKREGSSSSSSSGDRSSSPVPAAVCRFVAENFITATPSLDLACGYGWNAAVLSALLDELVQRYRIDANRIHVTGFSMGGYGTWDLGVRTPERFASLVPVCGGGEPGRVGEIKHIPQWVHHGDLDDIIPLRASQQMVQALEQAGAADVMFTRYPDEMHDCWSAAYSDIEVYRWMFGCRRRNLNN